MHKPLGYWLPHIHPPTFTHPSSHTCTHIHTPTFTHLHTSSHTHTYKYPHTYTAMKKESGSPALKTLYLCTNTPTHTLPHTPTPTPTLHTYTHLHTPTLAHLHSTEKGIWEPSPEDIVSLYKQLSDNSLHIEWVSRCTYTYRFSRYIYR